MIVLIDDMKTPNDIKFDIIARNFAAGMLIMESGAVTELYLDHDLGEGTGTGYNILQICKAKKILPHKIHLITMNPVGMINMRKLLQDCDYVTSDNYLFRKRQIAR